MLLDTVPSYFYFTQIEEPVSGENLLDEAADLTSNRMGLVDESTLKSYVSYFVLEKNVDYVQGWDIQGRDDQCADRAYDGGSALWIL